MMLDIHLFGKLRRFAENSSATDDSVVYLEYIEGETMGELLDRMGIKEEETGELFVANKSREMDFVIPNDNCRIAIFPLGMHLLCGGQHLKGHGYITKYRLNPIQKALSDS